MITGQVRTAGPADADAIAELERICLGSDAWSPALVTEAVTGSTCVLVASDPVVGYAALSIGGDVADLQRIAVDPVHRRRGFASQLLDAGLDWCREAGAHRLLVEAREGNREARGFYAAHGFAEIYRRTRYYADGETALVLELKVKR